jgi:aspartate/methionine/tyrosine aminotransferase
MNRIHISRRAMALDISGIRRVFELGAKLKDPINLSIGQPDFPVPDSIKHAAVDAIRADRNGYTVTQGTPEVLHAVARHLRDDVGWDVGGSTDLSAIITSGTSGALLLACLALLDPGDEMIVGDPYFVLYPALGPMTGGSVVTCDTYPDFRLTAERVERMISSRTRLLILSSPSNPCGAVLSSSELQDLVDLCDRRGVLIIADEIYDEFTYAEAREDGRCPSPARFTDRLILVRGFGKTYGCTGWRMGYAAGPRDVIQQMAKLQQYTFVCAPSIAQHALARAFEVDMQPHVAAYQRKRDMVVAAFRGVTELVKPGGAFYAFVKVPDDLGMSALTFCDQAIERNLLIIPGQVFSARDTHFRLSYATSDAKLEKGLAILRDMMGRPD